MLWITGWFSISSSTHTSIFDSFDLQLKYEKIIGTKEAAKMVSHTQAHTHTHAVSYSTYVCMLCVCACQCSTRRWFRIALSSHFHTLYTYRLHFVGAYICMSVCAHKFGVAIDKRLWRHGRWSFLLCFACGQRNDQKAKLVLTRTWAGKRCQTA